MRAVAEGGRVDWFASRQTRPEVDVASLVEQHGAVLFRVAMAVVRNAAEAEDLVQEAFVRALEQRSKLLAVQEPRAWLVRVVWNLAVDRRRRRTPEQMEDAAAAMLASAELPADRRVGAAAELARVLEAIDQLPRGEREVLLLHAVEELNMAEIAAVMGRSESGVRSLLFRARTHLEQRLAQQRRVFKGGRHAG